MLQWQWVVDRDFWGVAFQVDYVGLSLTILPCRSGSAFVGGILIDRIGYRYTFLVTAMLQVCLVALPHDPQHTFRICQA